MKILFYNHTGQASGAEYLLLMILARLNRESFDPVVLCPESGPLKNMVADLSVPVEIVAALDARFTSRGDHLARYLKSFIHVVRNVRRKVVTIEPDLIHANSIRAGLVATVATIGLGTKVIWHLHDLLPRHPLSTLIRFYALLSTRARMIAVSRAVTVNFSGAFSALTERVTAILNGIDLGKFQQNETARQEVRGELKLSEAEFVIGIVGQLTPRKGQLELVRAFATVLKELPRATLVIVGAPLFNRDEEYAQLLKDTALKLGIAERVRLIGARGDVPTVMQALDLLVVNSWVEPFGLVALESMACGTPVLAAISGGIPELLEHDRNGWLIPQGDERALAGAIVNLARRPTKLAELAARGKSHIASCFSAERYMNELQAFYQSNCDQAKLTAVENPRDNQAEAVEFA